MSFVMASFVFGFAFVSGGVLAYALCLLASEIMGAALDKLIDKLLTR